MFLPGIFQMDFFEKSIPGDISINLRMPFEWDAGWIRILMSLHLQDAWLAMLRVGQWR
jgi:hypothetical protein